MSQSRTRSPGARASSPHQVRPRWPRSQACAPETEKAEDIHLEPVRAGLVERAADWLWSSVRDHTGSVSGAASPHPVLPMDRILLPADGRARI